MGHHSLAIEKAGGSEQESPGADRGDAARPASSIRDPVNVVGFIFTVFGAGSTATTRVSIWPETHRAALHLRTVFRDWS
jgi:hypothetical protein